MYVIQFYCAIWLCNYVSTILMNGYSQYVPLFFSLSLSLVPHISMYVLLVVTDPLTVSESVCIQSDNGHYKWLYQLIFFGPCVWMYYFTKGS